MWTVEATVFSALVPVFVIYWLFLVAEQTKVLRGLTNTYLSGVITGDTINTCCDTCVSHVYCGTMGQGAAGRVGSGNTTATSVTSWPLADKELMRSKPQSRFKLWIKIFLFSYSGQKVTHLDQMGDNNLYFTTCLLVFHAYRQLKSV